LAAEYITWELNNFGILKVSELVVRPLKPPNKKSEYIKEFIKARPRFKNHPAIIKRIERGIKLLVFV